MNLQNMGRVTTAGTSSRIVYSSDGNSYIAPLTHKALGYISLNVPICCHDRCAYPLLEKKSIWRCSRVGRKGTHNITSAKVVVKHMCHRRGFYNVYIVYHDISNHSSICIYSRDHFYGNATNIYDYIYISWIISYMLFKCIISQLFLQS